MKNAEGYASSGGIVRMEMSYLNIKKALQVRAAINTCLV